MKLGISSGVIDDELAACRKILQEWEQEISGGLPMIDKPGKLEDLQDTLRNFMGEILYVSDKLASLVTRMLQELE